jgi:nucleoside-diphosphate-sugar epimerase
MANLTETRVLVTGASGFIGSALVRRLLAEKADVYAICRSISTVKNPRLLDNWDNITIFEGNLQDYHSIKACIDSVEPEKIYHLGAYTHVGRSFDHVIENLDTNTVGTVNLLKSLENIDFDSLVYISSSEVYGPSNKVPFREDMQAHPVSPYSISKYAGELFCKMSNDAFNYPVTILRLFTAYGPFQSPNRLIPEVISSCLLKKDFKMTSGKQTREFNYVDDLVNGIIKASLTRRARGETINLGNGEDFPILEITKKIISMIGNPIKPIVGALEYRPIEIWRMVADNTKARNILKWRPQYSLDEGLKKTIDWYNQIYLKNQNSIYLL